MSRFPSRRPRRLALIAVVAVAALVTTACGGGSDDAVATVGERSLSESDFEALVEVTGEDTDAPVVAADLAAGIIGEWITWESWIAEMAERGTPLTDVHLDLARTELESGAIGVDVAADSAAGEIFTRYLAVQHLVADHMIEAEEIRVLCSSHILVETEEEAEGVIERIDAGEDFAALAMELSTGPSGPTGGDLGCVAPRSFVTEFVDGAALVDAPGISAPTRSDFGWHVISVRSFDTPVRDEHPELTSSEITQFVLGGYDPEIREIRPDITDREIDVDSRFGFWDPAAGQVVPPTAAG